MFRRKHVGMALGAALGVAGVVWACGPTFPNQLLDHRAASLKATPQNDFSWEAQHLLVATDALKANESAAALYDQPTEAEVAKAQGLTLVQLLRVTALRQASDGDRAYDDGEDLPEDLRLYTAGAVDYAAASAPCKTGDGTTPAASGSCAVADGTGMARATARFEKVLALPPEQARLRSVWAAYMLGRIHAMRADEQASDAGVFKAEHDAAAKAFQLARTRAVGGASDTQGLAVASFGEQARLSLYSGN